MYNNHIDESIRMYTNTYIYILVYYYTDIIAYRFTYYCDNAYNMYLYTVVNKSNRYRYLISILNYVKKKSFNFANYHDDER